MPKNDQNTFLVKTKDIFFKHNLKHTLKDITKKLLFIYLFYVSLFTNPPFYSFLWYRSMFLIRDALVFKFNPLINNLIHNIKFKRRYVHHDSCVLGLKALSLSPLINFNLM